MSLQTLSTTLQTVWGKNLKSILRYGAAAVADRSPKAEDQSLLIVMETLHPADLGAASDAIRSWVKAGHPYPFVCDMEFLQQSADIFPIEYLDMQDHHEVVLGADPLAGITVDTRHLRLQCESDLKGKLLHLQSEYVLCCHRPRELLKLMGRSLNDFDRVFVGLAHLLGQARTGGRRAVVAQLAQKIDFSPAIFDELYDVHDGRLQWRDLAQLQEKFQHYLTALQLITRFANNL